MYYRKGLTRQKKPPEGLARKLWVLHRLGRSAGSMRCLSMRGLEHGCQQYASSLTSTGLWHVPSLPRLR